MSTEKVYFDDGFEPSENDIIVGRQKMASLHSGNLRLNEITDSFLEAYRQSTVDKTRKSQILAETFDAIRRLNGRFVKLDSKENRWYEVTKSVARERISQQYRDSLKDCYKSSLAHKTKRRLVKKGSLLADDPSLQAQGAPRPPSHLGNKRPKLTHKDVTKASDMPSKTESVVPEVTVVNSETKSELQGSNALVSAGSGEARVSPTDPKINRKVQSKAGDVLKPPPLLPRDGIRLMDEGFVPQTNDVVVGLRKRSAQHPGNIHLVEVVKGFLEEYNSCGNNRSKKSDVLNKIANILTKQDPPTRFVRLDPNHQRWYEIEAFCAREKISQCARDISQFGYRSANTFKNLKRRKSASSEESCCEGKAHSDCHSDTSVADGREAAANNLSNKRLPPKKAAARQIAAAGSASETLAKPTVDSDHPASKLSKKEQLERQIELLKKELAQLEDEEGKVDYICNRGGDAEEAKSTPPDSHCCLTAGGSITIVDDGPKELKAV